MQEARDAIEDITEDIKGRAQGLQEQGRVVLCKCQVQLAMEIDSTREAAAAAKPG
jgi:hypothetical protein